MTKDLQQYIALGSRLRGIPEVLTLGVRPNFSDYNTDERKLIQDAGLILYPTLNYAQFFQTIGKKIFPSLESYLYADDKIKQSTLFSMLGISHPRTRFYYAGQRRNILCDFNFPFIAKIPRRSCRGRGVFKISNEHDLEKYLKLVKVAYVQEYLPHERDMRIILINYRPVLAYWRVNQAGNFRSNLSQGGTIDFQHIPEDILELAADYARRCRLNDVGMDFIFAQDAWHLIEANMMYGREGLKKKGLTLKEILRQKLLAGELTDSRPESFVNISG